MSTERRPQPWTAPRAFEFVFSCRLIMFLMSRIQYVIFVFMIYFSPRQTELNEEKKIGRLSVE